VEFGTKNQSQILALLFCHPDEEMYMSEIGEAIGKCPGVFQKGINALEGKGIITSRKRGNQRLFRLNEKYPLLNEIKSIVYVTAGVEAELRAIVESMHNISVALIYGSYASGVMRPDSDIDVLIVGADNSIEDKLMKRFSGVEKRLRREINYTFYLPPEFKKKLKENDPFIENIRRNKHIVLKGEPW
jgi:predicted nucleotidyltransferase